MLVSLRDNRHPMFKRIVKHMSPCDCLWGEATAPMSDGSTIILKDKKPKDKKPVLKQVTLHRYFKVLKPKRKPMFKQLTLHSYFKSARKHLTNEPAR